MCHPLGCVFPARLCAISPGGVLGLLPLNKGTHISPTLRAVITWANVDQSLWCHWEQCILIIGLCAQSVLKQGNAHRRADVAYHRTKILEGIPYPEAVYTGWSSVHWNTTGMPLVDPVYTGIPLEKLSWIRPTWDATGETLTFAAYTGTPLEGLWQPTRAPTQIVKHAE